MTQSRLLEILDANWFEEAIEELDLGHPLIVVLQDLGLWHDIAKQGVGAIRFIDVREPNNHGEMHMLASEKCVDALGYVVELSDVVAAVYAALKDKVTMFCPANVTHVHRDDVVSISIQYQGQPQTLQTKLLIAADGTHSQIRRMAGIATHGWDHNRFGLVASIRCERDHGDTAYECFRQSGPLACLPLADGRFSIVWALAPQEAMRMLNMPDRRVGAAAVFGKRCRRTLCKGCRQGPRFLGGQQPR